MAIPSTLNGLDIMIHVDKDVPVPNSGKNGYPFKVMGIGESFVVASIGYSRAQVASQYYKRHGKKFTWRKQPDGTYRCWRTE